MNNIEYFFNNVFTQYEKKGDEDFTEEETEYINEIMMEEFPYLIPDAHEFHNFLKFEFYSIDVMYDSDEFEYRRPAGYDMAEMHDTFVALIIDIFNMHSYDSFLRQLIILLISRYHSERAGFIRNLDRTLIFFDNSDYMFLQWTRQQLDAFLLNSEKSNILLMKIKNTISEFSDDIEEIDVTPHCKILSDLKRAVVYESKIIDVGNGRLGIEFKSDERRIHTYAQNLYRNLKVYDYMINFLLLNEELLIKVRTIDSANLKPNQKKIVKMTRKIFKRIFRVLEVITRDNPRTQELMWKYKEEFVFEQLGSREQEGELELVLAIIDDSHDAVRYQQHKWTPSKSRKFVNSLNKRIKGYENSVLILEIYNKLIKFEAVSFLKPALIKLTMQNTEEIHSYDKENRKDFETSLNLQEIVHNIICNQKMYYIRDFFKNLFPLKQVFDEIESSILNLDHIEESDDTSTYDAQDYEELRECQYISLINIYAQLYLNPMYSDTTKSELVSHFFPLATIYIDKLNDFRGKADFKEVKGFRKSELKFLMIYMKGFVNGFKRYLDAMHDRDLSLRTKQPSHHESFVDDNDYGGLGKLEAAKKKLALIDKLTNSIIESLEKSNNKDLEEITHKIQSDYENTGSLSVSYHKESKRARHTSIYKNENTENRDKIANMRSSKSTNFKTLWMNYVNTVRNSRESRKLIDKEHEELAMLIFKNLTNKWTNPLLVQSFRTLLSQSIDYVYSCEKANWTLYIVVFVFKVNS